MFVQDTRYAWHPSARTHFHALHAMIAHKYKPSTIRVRWSNQDVYMINACVDTQSTGHEVCTRPNVGFAMVARASGHVGVAARWFPVPTASFHERPKKKTTKMRLLNVSIDSDKLFIYNKLCDLIAQTTANEYTSNLLRLIPWSVVPLFLYLVCECMCT